MSSPSSDPVDCVVVPHSTEPSDSVSDVDSMTHNSISRGYSSPRKMKWDREITNFVYLPGQVEPKKTHPFVEDPGSEMETKFWTKVGELKPWGKPGELGKKWDQVAAELCSPIYPDNTAVFTKLSGKQARARFEKAYREYWKVSGGARSVFRSGEDDEVCNSLKCSVDAILCDYEQTLRLKRQDKSAKEKRKTDGRESAELIRKASLGECSPADVRQKARSTRNTRASSASVASFTDLSALISSTEASADKRNAVKLEQG